MVLDQSGRARLHDTRAALNNIALGLEVLRHELAGSGSASAPRVLDIMQRDLAAAADELSGIHALLTSVSSDELTRLASCLEWADQVARPVARRCGVSLAVPLPSTVPVRDVNRCLAVAVAEALVEATLQGPRGSRCALSIAPDRDSLLIEWRVADAHAPTNGFGSGLLDLVPGSKSRFEADGDRRALTIELTHAA